MKRYIQLILKQGFYFFAILSLAGLLMAQEPVSTPEPVVPEQQLREAEMQAREAQRQVEEAERKIKEAKKKVEKQTLVLSSGRGGAGATIEMYGGGRGGGMMGGGMMGSYGGRSTGWPFVSMQSESLFIPSDLSELEQLSEVNEDLTIMNTILHEIIFPQPEHQGNFHFIIHTQPQGRNIYLAGYGVLFLYDVNFPLKANVQEVSGDEPVSEDEVWEQMRQRMKQTPLEGVFEEPEVAYNAEHVNGIQDKLISALSHAANIRSLKPNHWIVVVLMNKDSNNAESRSILRARKQDVDAAANKEISAEEFRDKVTVLTF